MANTNIFKKYLNIFVKNKKNRVIIQHENDNYYICDGFILLRLPVAFYNVYARTISPIFCELENGQSATRNPGEMLSTLTPPSNSLVKIFADTTAENAVNITNLCFMNKSETLRYIVTGDKISVYNNDYITAALDFIIYDQLKSTSDRFPILKFFDDVSNVGVLIMPYNGKAALQAISDVVEVLKK